MKKLLVYFFLLSLVGVSDSVSSEVTIFPKPVISMVEQVVNSNVFSTVTNSRSLELQQGYDKFIFDQNGVAHVTESGEYYVQPGIYFNKQISVEADDVALYGNGVTLYSKSNAHKSLIYVANVGNVTISGFSLVGKYEEGIHIEKAHGDVKIFDNWLIGTDWGIWKALMLQIVKVKFYHLYNFTDRYDLFKQYFPIPEDPVQIGGAGIWIFDVDGNIDIQRNYSIYHGPGMYVGAANNVYVAENSTWNTGSNGIGLDRNESVLMENNLVKHTNSNGLDGAGFRQNTELVVQNNIFYCDEPIQQSDVVGEILSIDGAETDRSVVRNNICLNTSGFASAGILLGYGDIEVAQNFFYGPYKGVVHVGWDGQQNANPYIHHNIILDVDIGMIFSHDTTGRVEGNKILNAIYGISVSDAYSIQFAANEILNSEMCGICFEDRHYGGVRDLLFEDNAVDYNKTGINVCKNADVVNVIFQGGSLYRNDCDVCGEGDSSGIIISEDVLTDK